MLPAAKIAASTLAFTGMFWAAATPLCAASLTGVSPKDEVIAKQFADAIDSGSTHDARSPDILNTRLGFAEFLAKAEGGDCHVRLDTAQDQLDIARASQAGSALPFAPAREAAVDYQIHVGRASCGSSADMRDQELRAAVESARHAVDLYRDELDAVSMVTMQFNIGVTYHELGEYTAAVEALQTAIKMDREYGFREDANDNYKILLQWNDQPAGPNEVAALMNDFPQRSATLSFGWFDSKANLTLTLEYDQLSEGGALNMHGTKVAERRVKRRANGWAVSFEPSAARYEISNWPNDESLTQGIGVSLIRMPIQFHDFDLERAGNFLQSSAARKFESIMRSDVKAVTEFLAKNNVPSRLRRQIRYEADRNIYDYAIEARVAEAYNVQTGAWIGASLDQGVWYDMSAPLSLPIAGGFFLMHQIEFAFTRQVPCTADSTDEACVEIVLRATPDPEELKKLLMNVSHKMGLDHKGVLQLSSATYMRLVTEPKTLQFYESDMRRYAYWATKGTKFYNSALQYESTNAVSGPIVRTE